MQRALEDLIRALRVAGYHFPADLIDAHRAIDVTGFGSRAGEACALQRRRQEREAKQRSLTSCSMRFSNSQAIKTGEVARAVASKISTSFLRREGSLAQIMLSGDEASLSMAMASAANRIGLSGIRALQPSAICVCALVEDEMGMPEVDAITVKSLRLLATDACDGAVC